MDYSSFNVSRNCDRGEDLSFFQKYRRIIEEITPSKEELASATEEIESCTKELGTQASNLREILAKFAQDVKGPLKAKEEKLSYLNAESEKIKQEYDDANTIFQMKKREHEKLKKEAVRQQEMKSILEEKVNLEEKTLEKVTEAMYIVDRF